MHVSPRGTPISALSAAFSTILQRRIDIINGALTAPVNMSVSDIPQWMSSLGQNGQWPSSQINYATGCEAERALWPAEDHWERILFLSSAWTGGLDLPGAATYAGNGGVRSSIKLAMDWWFKNDFSNNACVDSGGTHACPCGTPGLWNTNWFSSIILIPDLVGQSCILLEDSLTPTELSACTRMLERSYNALLHGANGLGNPTGSNLLDISRISIDLGLLSANETIISTAYQKAHTAYTISDAPDVDGIMADGSFGQHNGILYNGNYGKDFARDVLILEQASSGTQYEANDLAKAAIGGLLDGDKWMIFQNIITGTLHWDFSVLGRMITYPIVDGQATSSILLNISAAAELGQAWNSANISSFATSLSQGTSSSNVGPVLGNRMFNDNDYMVHRGNNYVSTLRMYSHRTLNSECTNSQNPFGFHLADGARYTYVSGNEYEDTSAAWDWNIIPGITTDYGATPLSCDLVKFPGLESFVGGVSNGNIGIGTFKYKNPLTQSFKFQKAWFFLPDREYVVISNITTTHSPVYSVLDQKRHNGSVIVDGTELQATSNGISQQFSAASTLWHDGVGYLFGDSSSESGSSAAQLNVDVETKIADWSSIGASISPPTQVDLFSAWLNHSNISQPISYTVFPGQSQEEFQASVQDATNAIQEIQNDVDIVAIYDPSSDFVMVIFFDTEGGSTLAFKPNSSSPGITISSNISLALLHDLSTGDTTVADPTQNFTHAKVSVGTGASVRSLAFVLPSTSDNVVDGEPSAGGGSAGSSTTLNVYADGVLSHSPISSNSTSGGGENSSGASGGSNGTFKNGNDKLAYLALLVLFALLVGSAIFFRRRYRAASALRERKRLAQRQNQSYYSTIPMSDL